MPTMIDARQPSSHASFLLQLLLCFALIWTTVDAFVLPRANLPSETQQTNPMTTMTPSAVWLAESSQNDDNDNEDEEHKLAIDKATKAMTAFTNKYLKNTGTKLCKDPSVAAVVVKGLAEHKVQYGAPLCPCRFYENKEAEVKNGYWNCPCVPMRERHECHCMLFLTEDNAFVGDKDNISYDEVLEYGGGGA